MIKCLRDIWTVARYELLDSVRGKRFAIILLIYIAGAMLSCHFCISALHTLENQITETLQLDPSSSPGAVTDAIMKSETFRRMVREMVKDRGVAEEVLSMPPLAIIYAGLAFFFTPLLVMISTPSSIAHEVSSGSAKFALARVSRGAWCTGKFLGQALEIILPLMFSAVGVWVLARIRVPDLAGSAEIFAMITYGWKIWIYCLAYIGLALAVSQVCRSVNQAIAFGLIIWTCLTVIYHLARHFAADTGWRRILDVIPSLMPTGHRLDLWRSDMTQVLPAIIYLLTISMVYFSIGHLFFRKKNL